MAVTSCAGGGIELLKFNNDDESFRLDGVELKWLWKGEGNTTTWYKVDSPQYDALISRIKEIEGKYDCTITADLPNGEKNRRTPDVNLELMAGTFEYDIVLDEYESDDFKSGLFYSLNDLTDYIDWTDAEKFGSRNLLEGGMYNGEPHVVYPIQWPGFEGVGIAVAAYNRDLFKQNQLTDPHEFYEQQNWTYDTFEKEFISKIEISNTGDKSTKMYAFQTDEPDFYQCLIYSNNVQFIEKNSDGSLSAVPYPQSFVNAMTWGQNLIKNYGDIILYDSDTYKNIEFTSGYVFMTFAPTVAVTTGSIAYNENGNFDSGIMPLPAGPDATYGEWGQCIQGTYGFTIPITSKHAEAAAKIIDALCEPLTGFEDKRDFYDITFTDETDIEIYLQLGAHTRYDYTHVGDKGLGRLVGENFGDIVTSQSKSLTEGMERYRHIMTELIEEWMIPNYNTVYGK